MQLETLAWVLQQQTDSFNSSKCTNYNVTHTFSSMTKNTQQKHEEEGNLVKPLFRATTVLCNSMVW